MMTQSEFLNKIVEACRSGVLPGWDATERKCKYRVGNEAGSRCVAGLLIPDEVYTPDLDEGSDQSAVAVAMKLAERHGFHLSSQVEGVTAGAINGFQYVHDNLVCSFDGWNAAKFIRSLRASNKLPTITDAEWDAAIAAVS